MPTELAHGEHYTVNAEREGFTVSTVNGWGIGHTFGTLTAANAACRSLNDIVVLDTMASTEGSA